MSNPESFPIVEVVDPSGKRGLHVIWACVDPNEYWYVCQARKIPFGAFSEMARGIKSERNFLPSEPKIAIMDQRGGAACVDMETGETWFDRFGFMGLHYEQSTQGTAKIDMGLADLHEWLRPVWNPGLDKAIPKLRFCASVARMKEGPVWALRNFLWDESKPKAWHYRQAAKDWIDCLRYLATYPNLTYKRLAGRGVGPSAADRGLAATYRRPQTSPRGPYQAVPRAYAWPRRQFRSGGSFLLSRRY